MFNNYLLDESLLNKFDIYDKDSNKIGNIIVLGNLEKFESTANKSNFLENYY